MAGYPAGGTAATPTRRVPTTLANDNETANLTPIPIQRLKDGQYRQSARPQLCVALTDVFVNYTTAEQENWAPDDLLVKGADATSLNRVRAGTYNSDRRDKDERRDPCLNLQKLRQLGWEGADIILTQDLQSQHGFRATLRIHRETVFVVIIRTVTRFQAFVRTARVQLRHQLKAYDGAGGPTQRPCPASNAADGTYLYPSKDDGNVCASTQKYTSPSYGSRGAIVVAANAGQ